jgi:hypothetical protein
MAGKRCWWLKYKIVARTGGNKEQIARKPKRNEKG